MAYLTIDFLKQINGAGGGGNALLAEGKIYYSVKFVMQM